MDVAWVELMSIYGVCYHIIIYIVHMYIMYMYM